MIGRQLPFYSLLVPFRLIRAFAGFKGMREILPAILVAGAASEIQQFIVSNYHGPWLVIMPENSRLTSAPTFAEVLHELIVAVRIARVPGPAKYRRRRARQRARMTVAPANPTMPATTIPRSARSHSTTRRDSRSACQDGAVRSGNVARDVRVR